jgi:hypothetical protein
MAKEPYPTTGTRTPADRVRRESHWRKHLDEWRQSGLTKVEYCRRVGISRHALMWWNQEIRLRDRAKRRDPIPRSKPTARTGNGPSLVPVRVITTPSSPTTTASLEVLVGQHILRVGPGFDPETFRQLLGVLEERPC